jgi:hypothetical protein
VGVIRSNNFDNFGKKPQIMDSIIVKPKNKESIPFLKRLLLALDNVDSIEVIKSSEGRVKKSIESGLKDAKDIVSGKKKGKTLRQLLDED